MSTEKLKAAAEEYSKSCEVYWTQCASDIRGFLAGAAYRDAELLPVLREFSVNMNTLKNDFWFMSNLLEHYSTNKEETIKDCIDRMNFRKPLFEVLTRHADLIGELTGEEK